MSSFLDPAALMRIKSLELRAKVYWGDLSTRSQCVAGLVADAVGGRFVLRGAGFASRIAAHDPGSPRLGSADPGLYYAPPLGLVCGGVVGRKVAAVEGGGFARCARCVSCASDWRECGNRREERGRNMGAGIATRCESVCERDMRQRGVSLRSTPRYRLRWLRHQELKRGFDNCHRSKGYQWTAIVTHQCRGGPQSGN